LLSRIVRRADASAGLGLASLYLAVMGGHNYSIDGVLIYRQAVSIAQNLSLQFARPIHWGDVYWTSKYGVGLSVVYVPGVKLLALLGIDPASPMPAAYDISLFYRDPSYALVGGLVHVAITVATALVLARLLINLGFAMKTAVFAMAAYGIASPALVYARGDFAQPLLGLCFTVGLLALMHYRESRGWIALVITAAALVLAVLSRPVEGSLLVPAALFLIAPGWPPARWDQSTYRGFLVVIGAYVLAVALTLAVNLGRFGSAFQTGYSQISWGTPIWIGLPGVLISPARGILWEFPLMVLAPLGFWLLWRHGQRAMATVTVGLALALLVNTALWVPWWGGWNWGSRLFVPALPLVALGAAIGVEQLRPSLRRWLPAALFALGVFWALPGTFTDLLGGYAGTYDGSPQSFLVSGYAPIGAWRFLHHLRANDLADSHAVDIIWFRIARQTHNLSLAVPVVFGFLAAALARHALSVAAIFTTPVNPQAR
jgi:hypothetical protein